ncbi:carboxypeptidase-like regulatory domain-containing protein [Acidobacterium sp. S8]|uniref:TonB-dependent receptor n=1 Tax=Acidobacterium sp. S8 TaxID=1641854 RepID=UPI00131E84BC|nr:carboxypeptidase-like regulatory domain-containing protein [Acidobacterium sp. S8]
MRFARVVGVFLMSLCCSLFVFGQATTSLRGHVTDASGAVVPGAQLTLTLTGTGAAREGRTDSSGEYQFLQLAPGNYTLKVSAEGFSPVEKQGMNLLVGQPATEDVALAVGTVTQQVTVDTNVQPVLNTTDATLGNAFAEKQVQSLPIEGRNVPDLLSLQPGVTYLGRTDDNNGTNAVGNNGQDSRSGTVNGGRSDQSNITLDGVDVNDLNNGYAFTSVLRVTQDSVGEFRVTTSNPDAAEGRSSGAQVGLITRGGTNQFHGAVYEYNRSNLFEANDFFNKQQQLATGEPNTPPKLIRNVFGAAVGGPILRDKLFAFLNYEGRRDTEGQSVNAGIVPLQSFRNGNIQYQTNSGSIFNLAPSQIQGMDPQGIGDNPNILQLYSQYPQANDPTQGDTYNTGGFRFPYTLHRSYDTYIARMDWNITKNGNHTIFWRGNLQGDNEPTPPAFPGQPPSTSTLTNSRGLAVGYTAVLTPNLVNTARYGFTRQGVDNAGISKEPQIYLAAVAQPESFSRSTSYIIPVQNVVDDLSWTKHDHSFQFGVNIRFIDDQRASDANSYPDGQMNQGWLSNGSTVAGNGGPFDPAAYGYPAVNQVFVNQYNDALLGLVGIITEGDAIYNYTKQGTALPLGTVIKRDYRWNEYEFYAQDSWKALKNLTLTYGLRWSLLQSPAETTGTQVGTCKVNAGVCQPFALTDYYQQSAQQGISGGAASAIGDVSFDLNGRYNGKPDFWNMEKNNIGPRLALAYSPTPEGGFLNKIFGNNKSSIRAGYSLVYDHFGAATVNTFDTTGSYGLSSNISNPVGTVNIATAPRFTDINTIPASVLPAAPAGGFPATPDPAQFAISWGLDSKIKTPYSHLIDFSIARELKNGSSIEISYVGRLAHRLLAQEDVAMPINLTAAGTPYFGPAAAMAKLARAQVPVNSVQKVAYWESLFPQLDGADIGWGPLSATQNVYELFQQNKYNETYALFELDAPDALSGAGVNPNGSYPSFRFYHDQYSALYAWRSIGYSNYHALEVVYRQQFGSGLQADFNYTFSKSMDITSQAERLNSSGSTNYAQIMNTWNPNQLYGVSDYDARHQINANYIWDLPIGRGKQFLSNANRLTNAVIGGWQTTGIVRWTSGFPFLVNNGAYYPTNWDIQGYATQVAPIPSRAAKRGKLTQRFADPQAVFNSFDFTLPGGSGTRNPLRGDGYFSWDTGLNKAFAITERAKVQLRWEMFNVTNSVRFDAQSINSTLDNGPNFGQARTLLTNKRLAQFAARVEF